MSTRDEDQTCESCGITSVYGKHACPGPHKVSSDLFKRSETKSNDSAAARLARLEDISNKAVYKSGYVNVYEDDFDFLVGTLRAEIEAHEHTKKLLRYAEAIHEPNSAKTQVFSELRTELEQTKAELKQTAFQRDSLKNYSERLLKENEQLNIDINASDAELQPQLESYKTRYQEACDFIEQLKAELERIKAELDEALSTLEEVHELNNILNTELALEQEGRSKAEAELELERSCARIGLEWLTRIATHQMDSVDKASLLIQIEGFQKAAQNGLEAIAAKRSSQELLAKKRSGGNVADTQIKK